MARQNIALLAFNRGLVSPKALARVDLDRTKLSAEVYNNWIAKSQGSMSLRPGTKYLGSSYSDTGAQWIEFVAATDDAALVELTNGKMRIWLPSDTGNNLFETPKISGELVPLARPLVATTVTLADTGWANTSTGGTVTTGSTADVIPTMTAATTAGVTISANHENTSDSIAGDIRAAYKACDDNASSTFWQDTGSNESTTAFPTTWQIDFGASNTKAITSYRLQARPIGGGQMPSVWAFQRSDDANSWTTEDTQGSETSWGSSEARTYTLPGADTGTVEARRYWRFSITSVAATRIEVAEIEMFTAASPLQIQNQSGQKVFNAKSIGGLARTEKRVVVDTGDQNVEHSLTIFVSRGPVIIRVGSTQRDDDYVSEATLGTGYHNLAFTPSGNFWITLQSDAIVDRVVGSLAIGDSGTVEITTDYEANDLDGLRFDQSADVVYVDGEGVEPHKIERRGTGRSWSIVEFSPSNGPFLAGASSTAKLSVDGKYGNVTVTSDIPFFSSEQVAGRQGALLRLFHEGQSGEWPLGALNAKTDAIEVTGITDTGVGDTGAGERIVTVSVSGTYSGTIQIERSFTAEDGGFHLAATGAMSGQTATDTGTFSRVIFDPDDNAKVWYRARMAAYSSGVAIVRFTYAGGSTSGIARITAFNSNTSVEAEVLGRFSDTGSTEVWQEGAWSGNQGYPTAVALHGGRLTHAGGANLYMSVSDDYENYSDEVDGDAAPIQRTLGSGPVDRVFYLVSLLRLIVGTAGAEIAVRSSSLDEPLTPTNCSAIAFSTQGSANLRALKLDQKAIFVQRSTQRVFLIGFGQNESLGDYEAREVSMLVPDLLSVGIVSVAIQRQPDTRLHAVLDDGTVAILTYEPQEEVVCWTTWSTDGNVEKAMVLPGVNEDQVYYHVRRTINGATKRFLEKWAMESECLGDTGLSWLADCAISYTDTGRATTIQGADHLIGESVVVWGDDTGQTYPSRDYSADTGPYAQKTYTVDTGGNIDLTGTDSVHHAVVGLPYTADWKSTKLAYAAEAGTALAQMKRTDKIGFLLYKTHNNGLFFGSDTGHLDPLPRMLDGGAQVDSRKIYETLDSVAIPFPGLWSTDSRIHLRARAPRPATVLAVVPTVTTNEKV